MKTERSLGKSRNARLNQARKYVRALTALLDSYEGTPSADPMRDAGFWGGIREFAEKTTKCVHEASAYNNVMCGDDIVSDEEEYSLTDAGRNVTKQHAAQT